MKFWLNKPAVHVSVSKRHMILLEVLIAMFIVAMAILPLITPHFAILRAQKNFIATMKVDHYAHLLYVDILEQLHLNKISWDQIQDKNPIPFDNSVWRRIDEDNPPKLTGTYQFKEIKHKTNKQTGWSGNLYEVIITIFSEDKKKTWVLPYTAYILRKGPVDTTENDPTAPLPTQNPKKSEPKK